MGGTSSGGVAFLAHLGGFVAGAGLIKIFAKPELLSAHTSEYSATAVGSHQDRFWR